MPRIGSAYRQRRPTRGPGMFRLLLLVAALTGLFFLVNRYAGSESLEEVAAAVAEPPVVETTATPGSVVRWSGDSIEECRLGDDRFPPIDDACFIPVDLSRNQAIEASRVSEIGVERLRILIGEYPYSVQHIKLADNSRVNLSPTNQQRAAEEREHIYALWDRRASRSFSLPLHPPLERLGAASRFGAKRVFNGQPRSPHSGADFQAPQGTPVLAVEDGEVMLAEEHFFAGNSVFLDHGDGLISMFFHLHEIFVEQGESVTRGAVIGSVGSTGRSTGPHLHFGLRWRGARVDPSLLLGPLTEMVSVGSNTAESQ